MHGDRQIILFGERHTFLTSAEWNEGLVNAVSSEYLGLIQCSTPNVEAQIKETLWYDMMLFACSVRYPVLKMKKPLLQNKTVYLVMV